MEPLISPVPSPVVPAIGGRSCHRWEVLLQGHPRQLIVAEASEALSESAAPVDALYGRWSTEGSGP